LARRPPAHPPAPRQHRLAVTVVENARCRLMFDLYPMRCS
jgi:hypothetical protein